jgi:hypothetical protein
MNYIYSQTNRLEEPHSYMYTQFHGEEFLKAYISNRLTFIASADSAGYLGDQNADQSYLGQSLAMLENMFQEKSNETRDMFKGLLDSTWVTKHLDCNRTNRPPNNAVNMLKRISVKEAVVTNNLLRALIDVQTLDFEVTDTKLWIDRLIQRFEVTKKIFESYPPGFRKGQESSTNVQLYWLFALTLVLFYTKTQELKYLSSILKVCDLLCSLPRQTLQESIPAHGLELVLVSEVINVALLSKSKGVPLDVK